MCVDIHLKVMTLGKHAVSGICATANLPAPEQPSQKKENAEPVVTPWEVQGKVDYDKLIEKFGCTKIDNSLIDKLREIIKCEPHILIRRGIVFSHRDLDALLKTVNGTSSGKEFYLYTGRGPSSESMHLGHLVPFTFTLWLQKKFGVPLVIQITDDEKFLFKGKIDQDDMERISIENIKDIIAMGFDPKKTFIFRNYDYLGRMYRIVSKIQKSITASQARNCFGFKMEDNIGMWAFPSIQAAPCFSDAFPGVLLPERGEGTTQSKEPETPENASILQRITDYFGLSEKKNQTSPKASKKSHKKKEKKTENIPCLIPCAIDQDPYFRLTRDIAPRLGYRKPALIHAVFLPSLSGPETKMSGSVEGSCIYLTDTDADIKRKINKYAFTGGGQTMLDHLEKGGHADIDVPLQWLRFFLPWDYDLSRFPGCTATEASESPGLEADSWERLRWGYITGRLTSATLKAILIEIVQKTVREHREARALVTDEIVREFMRVRPIRD